MSHPGQEPLEEAAALKMQRKSFVRDQALLCNKSQAWIATQLGVSQQYVSILLLEIKAEDQAAYLDPVKNSRQLKKEKLVQDFKEAMMRLEKSRQPQVKITPIKRKKGEAGATHVITTTYNGTDTRAEDEFFKCAEKLMKMYGCK